MSAPTIGRIVHYALSEHDADTINRRQKDARDALYRSEPHRWPSGPRAYVGNDARAGDVLPMVVTSVFPIGEGFLVNGQVLLDGNWSLWVTSRPESSWPGVPGSWVWPPRVA